MYIDTFYGKAMPRNNEKKMIFTPDEIDYLQGIINNLKPGIYTMMRIVEGHEIPGGQEALGQTPSVPIFYVNFNRAIERQYFKHIYPRGIKVKGKASYVISFSKNIERIQQIIEVDRAERMMQIAGEQDYKTGNYNLFGKKELSYIQKLINRATPGEHTLLSLFGIERWKKLNSKYLYGFKFRDAVIHGELRNVDILYKKDKNRHSLYEIFPKDLNKSRPKVERTFIPKLKNTKKKVKLKKVANLSRKDFTKKQLIIVQQLIDKISGGHFTALEIFSGTDLLKEINVEYLEIYLRKALKDQRLNDIFDHGLKSDKGQPLYLIFHSNK